jgi:hypothetical protein
LGCGFEPFVGATVFVMSAASVVGAVRMTVSYSRVR